MFETIRQNHYFKGLPSSSEFLDIKERYTELTNNLAMFFKEIGIVEPLAVCFSCNGMIDNGFLSFDHQFHLNKDVPIFLSENGNLIPTGSGCCRNIASLLDDVLKKMNIPTCIAATRNKCLEHFNVSEGKYELFGRTLYNHVVNYIQNDTVPFFYDATKNQLLIQISSDYIKTLIRWGDDVLTKQERLRFGYMPCFNPKGENLLPRICSPITEEKIENLIDIIQSVESFWNHHIDYAEEFYQNNKNLYAEITKTADRVAQKQKKLKLY